MGDNVEHLEHLGDDSKNEKNIEAKINTLKLEDNDKELRVKQMLVDVEQAELVKDRYKVCFQ
jgi:hypothetical protein